MKRETKRETKKYKLTFVTKWKECIRCHMEVSGEHMWKYGCQYICIDCAPDTDTATNIYRAYYRGWPMPPKCPPPKEWSPKEWSGEPIKEGTMMKGGVNEPPKTDRGTHPQQPPFEAKEVSGGN